MHVHSLININSQENKLKNLDKVESIVHLQSTLMLVIIKRILKTLHS
jgi:hypothetical protein